MQRRLISSDHLQEGKLYSFENGVLPRFNLIISFVYYLFYIESYLERNKIIKRNNKVRLKLKKLSSLFYFSNLFVSWQNVIKALHN